MYRKRLLKKLIVVFVGEDSLSVSVWVLLLAVALVLLPALG